MPRKPQIRSRQGSNRPQAASRATSHRKPEMFWQCMACGALVDPKYGAGDDSWCPSCRAAGEVMGMEGQLPSPQMYGAWVARQERDEQERRSTATIGEFLRRHQSTKENEAMKRKKAHTGTYHCPRCFIEFDLVAEESLKCDQCQGPLASGTLDEVWSDEPNEVED
jgi:rubrerythrin